jgi:hypothetical protein
MSSTDSEMSPAGRASSECPIATIGRPHAEIEQSSQFECIEGEEHKIELFGLFKLTTCGQKATINFQKTPDGTS